MVGVLFRDLSIFPRFVLIYALHRRLPESSIPRVLCGEERYNANSSTNSTHNEDQSMAELTNIESTN
jgi:hypothetical protein